MKTIWFFGVNNTTLDISHRAALAERKEWQAYYAAAKDDVPLPWVKHYFSDGKFKYGDHRFLTAQGPGGRERTLEVLAAHGMLQNPRHLLMRDRDYRDDRHIHKLQTLVLFAAKNPETRLYHFDAELETVELINELRSERIKSFGLGYKVNPRILDLLHETTLGEGPYWPSGIIDLTPVTGARTTA